MIEPHVSTEISTSDKELLTPLIGSVFRFLGGKDLPEFLMASQIVVSTTGADICFEGDVTQSSVEGYVENYSKIKLNSASQKELSSLQARGHIYYQRAGDVIRNVFLVRRVITEFRHGLKMWSLATTRAIVFDFGASQIAISKLGEHDEALAVTETNGFDISKLPETSNYFESDLETEYQVHDELVGLNLTNV